MAISAIQFVEPDLNESFSKKKEHWCHSMNSLFLVGFAVGKDDLATCKM